MTNPSSIYITETPRDALQGWPHYVPAAKKAEYINLLLKCGFETVDVGSFVSPKAVPQMADTAEVISSLDTTDSNSKLMVVAGNVKGGLLASAEDKVNIIAYPYSVSETFLKRNLNTTPEAAFNTVIELKNITDQSKKNLRVYVSMALGNPYGDKWNDKIVIREVEKLYDIGIRDLVFSDITGEGNPEIIDRLFSTLISLFHDFEPGIHLHTKICDWQKKAEAAWNAGIRNFEGALGGFGGCPMTGYELLGNLDTSKLLDWCETQGIKTGINTFYLEKAKILAANIFK